MSAPAQIDYDALAAQHGGSAAVDYDALAAQHGGSAVTQGASSPQAPQDPNARLFPSSGGVTVSAPPSGFLNKAEALFTQYKNRLLNTGGMDQGARDTVASLPAGLLRVGQGATELAQSGKRLRGAGDIIGGAAQAATMPASFVAPEAASADLPSLLPEAKHAGQLFNEVREFAKGVPVAVDLKNSQEGILGLMDWQKKTQLGPTINKFLNRVSAPNKPEMDYNEARDFYTLLKGLSMNEASKLAGPVKFELSKMLGGLRTDIGDAAAQIGQGQKYYDAMHEFASAKRLEDLKDTTKSIIIEALQRALPNAIGGGMAYYGARKFLDSQKPGQ